MGVASPHVEMQAITIPETCREEPEADERLIHKVLMIGDKFMHISPFQRYLGNSRTKEIHDLGRTMKGCKVKDCNKVFFGSKREAERVVKTLRYDGCKRCFRSLPSNPTSSHELPRTENPLSRALENSPEA
jgi:hypothetical protein